MRRKERAAKARLMWVMLKDDENGENDDVVAEENKSLKRGACSNCGQEKMEPTRLIMRLDYVSGYFL